MNKVIAILGFLLFISAIVSFIMLDFTTATILFLVTTIVFTFGNMGTNKKIDYSPTRSRSEDSRSPF